MNERISEVCSDGFATYIAIDGIDIGLYATNLNVEWAMRLPDYVLDALKRMAEEQVVKAAQWRAERARIEATSSSQLQ